MPIKPNRSDLTQDKLRSLLDYDPATGVFTWLVNRRGGAHKGARAGTVNCCGYRQIKIDNIIYMCTRLAVLWLTGQWPEQLVEHLNLNNDDDSWDNLRQISYSQRRMPAPAKLSGDEQCL